jgi:lipopolysaccharide transport system permease protein
MGPANRAPDGSERRGGKGLVSKIELVVTGGPRPSFASALADLRAYRTTVLAFAERDVRVKYKQALLGFALVALQPLAFMALFTLVLGRYAHVSTQGVPYAAFALSVLVPWFFLSNAVLTASNALIADAPLLRKVFFPREVPVIGSVLAQSVDLALGLILFAAIGPPLGARVSPTWLVAPLLAVPLAVLAIGLSLTLGGLNVYYRDFRHLLPFLVQIWLFASPVAYPLTAVPERWRELYVVLNPAAGVLDSFRRSLALGKHPDPVSYTQHTLPTKRRG